MEHMRAAGMPDSAGRWVCQY